MSLELLVKLAENDLYHNESYESSPPFIHNSLLQISKQVDFGFQGALEGGKALPCLRDLALIAAMINLVWDFLFR